MAFRYNELGAQVTEEPKVARARLAVVFAENNFSMRAVARELGIDRATL